MSRSRGPGRWLKSTSNRTFVVLPLALIAIEILLQRRSGKLRVQPVASSLMLWGYLQYRWVGKYRARHGGGGPGLAVPPERLCTEGPYRWARNPMYLGHLIYLAGVALTLRSKIGALVFAAHVPWFHARVRRDEAALAERFGAAYREYAARVKRWLPWIG